MDLLIIFLCVPLIFIILVEFLGGHKRYTLPPGPKPYPLIGNLLELGHLPHKSFAKLSNIYGPIMSLKLGQITAVIVSSPSMAKEFLQTHDVTISTNRAITDAVCSHNFADYSMGFLPVSTHWRILRKMFNSHIFNAKKLDETQHIRDKKVQDLVDQVDTNCHARNVVDIGRVAFTTTFNIMSNIILSKDLVDPYSETAQFKELVRGFMEEGGKPNLADFFPVLKRIDPQGIRRRMTIHIGKMLDILKELVRERVNLRNASGSSSNKDALDVLLNICEDGNEEFQRDWIERLIMDIFIAGSDTTSTTVEWAMVELLRNPEALMQAQAELRKVIGKGHLVKESYLNQLPYLQAILKETLRLHPPAPLLVPRMAAADVEISGFTVPKGAQIIINIWKIQRDPSLWDDPNTFKPERFLGSDIDLKGKRFELLPFGAGRRICPGLAPALRIVPLMIASLIHSFNWELEDGVELDDLDMDEEFGITLKKAKPLLAIPLLI